MSSKSLSHDTCDTRLIIYRKPIIKRGANDQISLFASCKVLAAGLYKLPLAHITVSSESVAMDEVCPACASLSDLIKVGFCARCATRV